MGFIEVLSNIGMQTFKVPAMTHESRRDKSGRAQDVCVAMLDLLDRA
jgi:hypothetical protein